MAPGPMDSDAEVLGFTANQLLFSAPDGNLVEPGRGVELWGLMLENSAVVDWSMY